MSFRPRLDASRRSHRSGPVRQVPLAVVSPAVTRRVGDSGAVIDRQRGVIVAGGRGGVPVGAHRGAGGCDGMARARRPDQRRPIVACRGDDVRRLAPASGVRRRPLAGGRRADRPSTGVESARRVDRPIVAAWWSRSADRASSIPGTTSRSCARSTISTISAALPARRGRRAGDMPRSGRWRRSRRRWPLTDHSPSPVWRTSSPHRCPPTSNSSWRPRCPSAISNGSADRCARAHANRGANGIDGVVSTALGRALTGTPTVALVGDIAFVHDSNALVRLSDRPADLRIVVVDNDGGGIFSFLPQATALPADQFETLLGTPHGTDIEGLARAHGIPAATITDAARTGGASRHSRGRGSSASRRTAPTTSSSTTASTPPSPPPSAELPVLSASYGPWPSSGADRTGDSVRGG